MTAAPKFARSDTVHDALMKMAAKLESMDQRMEAGFAETQAEFKAVRQEIAESRDEVVSQLRGEIAAAQEATVSQLRGEIEAARVSTVAELRDEMAINQAATIQQFGQYVSRLERFIEQRLPKRQD